MNEPRIAQHEALPLSALLAAGLERHIRDGRLPSGRSLMANTIARSLDLSRAPVQTALDTLLQCGLIVEAGRSYKVAPGYPPNSAPQSDDAPEYVPKDIEGRIRSSGALWQRVFVEVEAEIGAAIPFGRFRIIEARMADTFGVSRTVVRGVLARLEERGLVHRDPRGDCTCGPLTEHRIAEIYEARILIEPFALGKVGPSLDPQWISDCLRRLDEIAAAYPNVPPAKLEELENDLHVRAFAAFDNRVLKQTLQSTRLVVISTTQLFQRTVGLPAIDPFLKEHRMVFEQLKAGAYDLAVAALRHHLQRAERTTLRRFQALPKLPSNEVPQYLLKIDDSGS